MGGTGKDSTVQGDRQAGRILGRPVLTVPLTYEAVSAARPFLTSTLQAADGARKAIEVTKPSRIGWVNATTTSDFPEARLPGLICSSRISVGTEIEFATSCGTDNDIRARRQTWLSVKLQEKEDTFPARQVERSIRLH